MEGQPSNSPRIVTIALMVKMPQYRDVWSEAALRALVFKAAPRFNSKGQIIKGNGLTEAGAIVRIGRRLLVNLDAFDEWVRAHGAAAASPSHRHF